MTKARNIITTLTLTLFGPFVGDAVANQAAEPVETIAPVHKTAAKAPTAPDDKSPTDKSVNDNEAENVERDETRKRNLLAYRAALKQMEERGPYYDQSSEALLSLGNELQKQAFHAQALDVLQRAMHVNRVNYGLNSISQAPMLRRIIHSEKALHFFDDASANYVRLLKLFAQNHEANDPALITVLKEVALWHVDVYQVDPDKSRVDHLTSAHNLMALALKSAGDGAEFDTEFKVDLLRAFARVCFFSSMHKGDEWVNVTDSHYSASADKDFLVPARMATLSRSGFRDGLEAHEQIIALIEADSEASPEQKITAYVDLGDWHLLFNQRSKAMEYYHRAQALITENGNSQKFADLWFDEPEFLPVYRAETGSADDNPFIVTAQVDISSSGSPSAIKIVAPSLKENRGLRRGIVNTIKNSRFRPRIVKGEAVSSKDARVKIPLIH
jgi:tetratricopeptide (TPR) repeat protein